MNDKSVTPPWAERLAAYFEGTLDADERTPVEDWLADHPEAAAEYAALSQLQRAFRAAAPPEPSEPAWDAVREGIELGLARVPVVKPAKARGGRAWVVAASAAAVLLCAVWLFQPGAGLRNAEPFPVAATEDVEIISVDAAGARALLVGEAPLQAPVVLMAAGDATLKSVEIEPDGLFPEVRMGPGPHESPMIVGPLVAGIVYPQELGR